MKEEHPDSINDEIKELDAIEKNLAFLKIVKPAAKKKFDPRSKKIKEFKEELHKLFLSIESLNEVNLTDELTVKQTKERLRKLIETHNFEKKCGLYQVEKDAVLKDMCDEIFGLGPLEDFMRDESVTEVMVNGKDNIFVEKRGRIERVECCFFSDDHLKNIIQKIVAPLGKRIDEASPIVDARLPDGSRVNAVISPVALDGSLLTIRKFQSEPLQMFDLIRFEALNGEMALFLKACVEAKINMIISGGTGSGKTTLLNVLSSFIGEHERIITVEDAAELQIYKHHNHVGRMESRSANIEGKGVISIRDLIKNALRMRPDRIIVGEVRGGEALDMMQAMNTGHEGSLTTAHANTPRDLISRIETMVLFSGIALPSRAIREQITASLDVIIQTRRLRDGRRVVSEISEVQNLDENDNIRLKPIFWYKIKDTTPEGKVIGKFQKSDTPPAFLARIREAGIEMPKRMFPDDYLE